MALKALIKSHQSDPFPYQVDFVLVFSEEDMENPNSAEKLETWSAMGGKTRKAKILPSIKLRTCLVVYQFLHNFSLIFRKQLALKFSLIDGGVGNILLI